MNRLKTATILFFFLILITNLSMVQAFALQMSTDKQVYSDGQPLLVYGTALPNEPLIIRLFAPDGTIAKFDQITADNNGGFDHILIRWPNATTNFAYGTYSVEAIATAEKGTSQKIDVKFVQSSSTISVPASVIQGTLDTLVFAPQTAAVNQPIRVFVQVTNDGLLVAGSASKLLGTSHVHLPDGTVVSLGDSFQTLHQGIYYVDYTPPEEGTYVFHITAFDQGSISQGSGVTVVLKQNIEGISNQIIKLNSVLDSTSQELDKLKSEIGSFGQVLNSSQQSVTQANQHINQSVSSMSISVSNLEAASGQFNSLFLPVVALIAIIIALQITILARRR
ncbi:MAG TPA: methyl-accepting chemotaxis protein [Nitrosopumilaceae archaeon]|nr:methyl-accepting chemotaxis protein [Nitrosopumilaceae archaeon]